MEPQRWVATVITKREVRGMLRIDRHQLDEALLVNSEVADRIGQQVVKATTEHLRAKKRLEAVEAEVTESLKGRREGEKLTNPQIERELKRDRRYLEAWEDWMGAREDLEEWELLQKSWYQRGFDLKALGELFAHQYFTVSSIGETTPRRRLRPGADDEVRARVAEAVNRRKEVK